ncbi:hypothetical protein DAMA08_001800 [Martiniozyma asiatica (nom. inval.)]|nr:hypothetical protein DAMA08_001800 [Martiniozyma asiatica]
MTLPGKNKNSMQFKNYNYELKRINEAKFEISDPLAMQAAVASFTGTGNNRSDYAKWEALIITTSKLENKVNVKIKNESKTQQDKISNVEELQNCTASKSDITHTKPSFNDTKTKTCHHTQGDTQREVNISKNVTDDQLTIDMAKLEIENSTMPLPNKTNSIGKSSVSSQIKVFDSAVAIKENISPDRLKAVKRSQQNTMKREKFNEYNGSYAKSMTQHFDHVAQSEKNTFRNYQR